MPKQLFMATEPNETIEIESIRLCVLIERKGERERERANV
jgi:hypothetical protein